MTVATLLAAGLLLAVFWGLVIAVAISYINDWMKSRERKED